MSIPSWDDIAEDAFWQQVPQDLHEEAVRGFLGSNGDAIDARVENLIKTAERLLELGFSGPAIATSTTAIEVMIQYFCVRPIVGGAILSDLLAKEVTRRIVGSRSQDQRSLLAPILRAWGIDITRVLLPSGKQMWGEIQSVIVEKRDDFIHYGDDVSPELATLAIDCARTFRSQVVEELAKKLGFTHDETGCWSRIFRPSEAVLMGGNRIGGETFFTRRTPFS